jgi:hypothetical protein
MRKAIVAVLVLLGTVVLLSPVHAAFIGWTAHSGAGVTDSFGTYLTGTKRSGVTVDLSQGALVQLIKAVGEIDDPGYPTAEPAFADPNHTLDDVILDQRHIGYGQGPPGQPSTDGRWNVTSVEVDIAVGDVLYVRAYNVPEPDIAGTSLAVLQLGIRDTSGAIVSNTVAQVVNPETYYFDNLQTVPIPEPASLLFLVPGLALWALRRKK